VSDEPNDLDTRARLAVLAVMGHPDDRELPAGEPSDTAPGYFWELAGRVVAAVVPPVLRTVADEHDLIASGPGIRPSATAWARYRADNWPDLEARPDCQP
jgi:hypothetical protein